VSEHGYWLGVSIVLGVKYFFLIVDPATTSTHMCNGAVVMCGVTMCARVWYAPLSCSTVVVVTVLVAWSSLLVLCSAIVQVALSTAATRLTPQCISDPVIVS